MSSLVFERDRAGKLQSACEAAERECVRDELLRYFHNILYDNNNNNNIIPESERHRNDD